jgi:hypothetical protein
MRDVEGGSWLVQTIMKRRMRDWPGVMAGRWMPGDVDSNRQGVRRTEPETIEKRPGGQPFFEQLHGGPALFPGSSPFLPAAGPGPARGQFVSPHAQEGQE